MKTRAATILLNAYLQLPFSRIRFVHNISRTATSRLSVEEDLFVVGLRNLCLCTAVIVSWDSLAPIKGLDTFC